MNSDFAITSSTFHQVYPDAAVGVMTVVNIINPERSSELEASKMEVESGLRQTFTEPEDLRNHAVIQAYVTFYKRFKKTYPVLAQLESVIFGDRSIPTTIPLVEAMFMAELDNMLLTAGHDLEKVNLPVIVAAAQGNENYTLMNGSQKTVKDKDMCMADKNGIISSVIYGPDQRTRIQAGTESALFVVYTPAGIQKNRIQKHLTDIHAYVSLFSPAAEIQTLEII